MAFRLDPGETAGSGSRRIAEEELRSSIALIHGAGSEWESPVHEARKSSKRLRALAKVLKPYLGPTYKRLNGDLREVGRFLSELRDSAALLETFEDLLQRYGDEIPQEVSVLVRAGLVANKHELDPADVLKKVERSLRKLRRRGSEWDIGPGDWTVFSEGLQRNYRVARNAADSAAAAKDPELFHEWRKRVKDQMFQLLLFKPFWDGEIRHMHRDLDQLQMALGEEHNLQVLRAQLKERPELFGGRTVAAQFSRAARKEQTRLRQRALSLGSELFRSKPKSFARHIESLWGKQTRR